MKILSDFIIKPIISEKSFSEAKSGKYTFKILDKASKTDVKNAIEKLFSVNVKGVYTSRIKNKRIKQTRYGRSVTNLSYKKARVLVAKGQKIDIFEEKTSDKKESKK